MRELRALTSDEFALAESRLRNPAPGSRIEAAKEFGVDLTLLIEQLRLDPESGRGDCMIWRGLRRESAAPRAVNEFR